MKIIYLSRSLLPSKTANSVHVMKMCQALAVNGHDVTLVASTSHQSSRNNIYDYYGVKETFEIKMLKGRADKFLGLSLFLASFYIYIKKIKPPDLFYGRDIFTLAIATTIFNIPFYYEAHKPPTTYIHLLLTKFLIRKNKLVRLIVITKALKEEYLQKFAGQLNQKILIAPDGADVPDENDLLKATKVNGDKTVIGYIGHLYPGRGMEIIHAAAKELPHYEFHIIGGNKKDINHWQNNCHALGNIHFKGFIQHKELYRYYKDIDIVLAPYQNKVAISGGAGDTSKWMSPLKIFEYMAFAKPIIASDLPALKEVLIDGFNAKMCKPDCIEEWISAIKLLAQNKDLSNHIATNAFECLKEKYTWEKRAAGVMKSPLK